jgi:hypothetical protein
MKNVPYLHHKLGHRSPGSFGAGPIGKVFEWITATWLRFEVFLAWLFLLAIILSSGRSQPESALFAALISPIPAILMVLIFRLIVVALLILPLRPLAEGVGWVRLCFLTIFSRLIVEPAPDVEMPLWMGPGRP